MVGFLGLIGVCVLFVVLIFKILKIANRCENTPTNQEYWTLSKFNDVVIKLPAISASNNTFGDATLSWRDTGIQDLTFSKSSKTWNNNNDDDSFTVTLDSNLPYIGSWSASASDGTLTFTSTTRNSSSTSGTITFSGTTYQDAVPNPSPFLIQCTYHYQGFVPNRSKKSRSRH